MEEICINPKELCFKRLNFDLPQEIKILNNSPNKKEIFIHLEKDSYLNVYPDSLEIKPYKEEKIYISLKQSENKEEFADIIQIQTDQTDYFVKVFGFPDKNTDSFRSSKSKVSSLKNSEDDLRSKIINLEQEHVKYLRKIDDLESELNNYKEFKNYTYKLKEILKSNGKLDFSEALEKALKQQNFENEKKISQIYDMMAIKDDIIMSLETKLREIESETYRLKEFTNKNYGEFSDEKKDKSFASILKEKEMIIEELYQENKKITMMNELSKIDQDPNLKINDFTFSPKQLRTTNNNENLISDMKNKIETLEKLLEEEKNKNLNFLNEQNEINILNEEIKKLKNEKMQSSRQINLLSHRLSQQNNDEDYNEVPKLNAEISQLKLKEDMHLQEHSKLQNMYSELIDELEKSKSEKQFSGEKSNPKSNHSSQNKSIISINEKVGNLSREIEIFKSCKEALEIRILDFINNEAYFQNKILLLETDNTNLAKSSEISNERNIELENNLFILENELSSLREQLKAEIEKIRNNSFDLNNSKDQNIKLLQTNEELKKKLEEYYYQLEHLTLDIDDKNEKIRTLDGKNQDFINKNDLLGKQVKNLTEEYETLRKSNFLWENEKKILQEKNIELSEKISLVINEKEKLYSENIIEINRVTKSYQEKIDLLKSQNRDLETKYLEHLNTRIQEENNWKNIEGNLLQQISALKESKLNRSLNLSRSDKKSSLSMSKTPRKRQESFEEKRFQGLSELHLVQQMQERENLKAKIYEMERKIDDLISEKHSLMQINNQLEINLENFKVENRNVREGKSLQLQTLDRQLMEELDYLRECMKELKFEKDRIGKELEMKEDNYKFENRENEKLIKFIRDLETRNHEKEAQCIEFNDKLQNNANVIEIFEKEMEMLKSEIRDKEGQIEFLAAGIDSSKNKQNDLIFQKTELEIKIKEIELANEQQENFLKNFTFEKTTENEELQKIIKNLREEMMLQNEKFNDIQKVSEIRLKYMKDKFNTDIKELFSKLEGAQKKNLTGKFEFPMNLEKILESYKENLGIISHKDASIKLLKDKTKQLQNEVKLLKSSCKQLNDTNLKLNDDLTQTMRKQKYQFGSMKENMKPNSDFNNETKINKSWIQISNNYVENTKLESQIYTLKLEIKRINEEASLLNEKNIELVDQLNISIQEISILKKEITIFEKESLEVNKDHQKDISELLTKLNESTSCRSNEEIEKYMIQLKEADEALKIARDEINRKKDMILVLKNEKDEKEIVIKELKDQILKLNEELEKNKKASKENNRKESNMKEFREKLDQTKINEKNWLEDKAQLNEKIRSLRGEMNRKDLFNKELKDKLDAALEKCENYNKIIDDNEKLKEQTKKLKIELDRKDVSILHLKNKLDECLAELSLLKADISNKPNMTISEFEKENKKLEVLKVTLKKNESHNSMLSYLLRRIYRETFSSISKIKAKKQALVNKQYQQKMNAFSDSIDILKIAPEDLGLFLEPNQNNTSQKNTDKFLEEFDALLENEKLDINKLHLMLNELIEERIEWEKTAKN